MVITVVQEFFNEAERLKENGRFQEAVEAYEKAIEADPFFLSAHYNLALVFCQTHQFEDAIIHLKKVTELSPLDASAHNNLGVLYFKNNDLDEARICFEKAVSIEADYQEALDNLKKIRQKLQEIKIQLPSSKTTGKGLHSGDSPRVGFVSIWFERGQSYVTKTLRDVIAREHETFVFARTGGVYDQPKLEAKGYWQVPNLTTYPDYQIPSDVIIKWIRDNNLDMIIFNEEYDWNLVKAAKSTGIKILTYLDYYKEDWKPYMRLYDAVLCSTKRTYNLVKVFCIAYYIGWGIDTELFKPRENNEERHTFFHNAGWLGINYRKMTPAVIYAFDVLSRNLPKVSLFVHAQAELERLPADIVKIVKNNPRITYHIETVPAPGLYHKGRILVFPSKLEGLGLPLLEGMACGLPAIATDAPPMNEFVKDEYNGLLVNVEQVLTREDNIAFPETIINTKDLAIKMAKLAMNHAWIEKLSEQARNFIVQELNINAFAIRTNQILIDLFKRDTMACLANTHQNPDHKFKTDKKPFHSKNSKFKSPYVTIHLVGAQESNYPWGIENRLISALKEIGYNVISTDFRKNREKLPVLLQQPADIMLICKGEGIPPELIRSAPCPTVLWYAEQIGTLKKSDPTAEMRKQELSFNVSAFDYVFSHDQGNLDVYRKLGAKSIDWLPTAAVDSKVHYPMNLEKIYDVTFIGTITSRRKFLIDMLSKKVNLHIANAWDPSVVNCLFNQSKIVLNIHLSDLLNTETRIAEVLGSGAFLLTEEISSPELFQEGKHMVSFKNGNGEDLASKIFYYLEHKKERESIADCGYKYVMTYHTFKVRIEQLFSKIRLKKSNKMPVLS